MSLAVKYQGDIGTRWINREGKKIATYNGKSLTVLQQSGNLNPVDYPICMSEAQFKAMELPSHVFAVLSATSISPATLAELDDEELCPVARRIEDIYKKSIEKYIDLLKDCVQADSVVWRQYENLNWTQRFWLKMTGRIWTDGSVSRLAWCNEVSNLEKERLNETKSIIEECCPAFLTNAKENTRHHKRENSVRVLRQLTKIYISISPECTPLIINGVNIQEYVNVHPPKPKTMPALLSKIKQE